MMKGYKEGTVTMGSKKKEENPELIERGIFVHEERPEYSASCTLTE
jgi:2-oxoglutarate ferredoxin oxidoreductase subunit beta